MALWGEAMATPSLIPMNASVVTTANVNLRQGAPDRLAPILRKITAGTTLSITGIAAGESVSGNAHWFLIADGGYVWAGACSAPQTVAPTAPISTTVSPVVRVCDLSHGDGVSDFALARRSGLLGVIHKATTGATGRDDAYQRRREAAKAAGLLWGAYHWGTAMPVEEQVDNFLGWAQPDDQTLVALDYEETPDNQMTLDQASQFLRLIQARLNRKAMIYSGGLIKSQLGNRVDPFLGSHRLWLAQYGSQTQLPPTWSRYWLWQYTDGDHGPLPRTVPGIVGDSNGRLDCDHFAGTDDRLRAEWAAGPA